MRLLIFCLTLLSILPLQAQVVGHSYYCWSGTLESSEKKATEAPVPLELLLEYNDSTQLAMGEIRYQRDERVVPIRLYGKATAKNKGLRFTLYEVLPSSSCAGMITLQLVDGQCTECYWEPIYYHSVFEINWETNKPKKKTVKIGQTKDFPHQEVASFFQPIEKKTFEGVYTLNNTGGESENDFNKVEISSISDSIYIANFSTTDFSVNDSFFFVMHKINDQMLEFESKKEKIHVQAYFYDDCVYFRTIADSKHKLVCAKTNYLRQDNQQAINYPFVSPKVKSIYEFISVSREGDRIKVSCNPMPLIVKGELGQKENYTDIDQFKSVETLTNVRPGVKQIFMSDIGEFMHPILAILNQDSTLQVYSPIDGYIDRYTNVSEPIVGLSDIVGFAYENPNLTVEQKQSSDYYTFYAVDAKGQYHEVPINRFAQKLNFTTNGENGSTRQHTIDMTYDWAIHYKLEVEKDETFEDYTTEYYGHCWADPDDPAIINYEFDQMLDTRDPGQLVILKPCRVKGKFNVKLNEEGQLVIKTISGIRFN